MKPSVHRIDSFETNAFHVLLKENTKGDLQNTKIQNINPNTGKSQLKTYTILHT